MNAQTLDTLEAVAAVLLTGGLVFMVAFREDEAVSGIRQSTERLSRPFSERTAHTRSMGKGLENVP